MTGTRIADATPFWEWPPGSYGPIQRDGRRAWRATTPNGLHGDLSRHDVTEHEDGTITVSPSILVQQGKDGRNGSWHGYLERGLWREC